MDIAILKDELEPHFDNLDHIINGIIQQIIW